MSHFKILFLVYTIKMYLLILQNLTGLIYLNAYVIIPIKQCKKCISMLTHLTLYQTCTRDAL